MAAGRAGARRRLLREALVAVTLAQLIYAPVASHANPHGGVVVAGDAQFDATGDLLTVTNAPGTIIDWQSFSIAEHEITRFVQEHARSAVLNRVVGQSLSEVLGRLESNGQVFLINPNGIVVGNGATIDTAGFVASTLGMSDADFLAGRLAFGDGSDAGAISQGGVVIAREGPVLIVAPVIENSGLTRADNGDLLLAAGRQVLVTDSRLSGVSFEVQAPQDVVLNLGQLIARGGSLGAFAGTLTSHGEISADSVTLAANGELILGASSRVLADGANGGAISVRSASRGGTTWAGGELSAQGATAAGGRIELLGEQVAVTGLVSADGATAGGSVRVGGNYLGRGPLLNARAVYVAPSALLSANATDVGLGGEIIVWSNELTKMYGAISARGAGARGGFVETSSANLLDLRGSVDVRGAPGLGGTWLLDPLNLTVVAGNGLSSVTESPTNTFVPSASGAQLGVGRIESALTGGVTVILDTNVSGAEAGDISFTSALELDNTTGSNSLQLNAAGAVTFAAPILDTVAGGQSLSLDVIAPSLAINANIALGGGVLDVSGSATITDAVLSASSANVASLVALGSTNELQLGSGLFGSSLDVQSGALTVQSGDLTTSFIHVAPTASLVQLAGEVTATDVDVEGTAVFGMTDTATATIAPGAAVTTSSTFAATTSLTIAGSLTANIVQAPSATITNNGVLAVSNGALFNTLMLNGRLTGLGDVLVQTSGFFGSGAGAARVDAGELIVGGGATVSVGTSGVIIAAPGQLTVEGVLNVTTDATIGGPGTLRNENIVDVTSGDFPVMFVTAFYEQIATATTRLDAGVELRLSGGGSLRGVVQPSVGGADVDLQFDGGTYQLHDGLQLLTNAGSSSSTVLVTAATLSVADDALVTVRGLEWFGTLSVGDDATFNAVGGGNWHSGTFSNAGVGVSTFLASQPFTVTPGGSKFASGIDLVMTGQVQVQDGITLADGTVFALRGPDVSLGPVTFARLGSNPLTRLQLEDRVTSGRHAGVTFNVATVFVTDRNAADGARIGEFVFLSPLNFTQGADFVFGPRVQYEGNINLGGGAAYRLFDSNGFLGVVEGTELVPAGAGVITLGPSSSLEVIASTGSPVHSMGELLLDVGTSVSGAGLLGVSALTIGDGNSITADIGSLSFVLVSGVANTLDGSMLAQTAVVQGALAGSGSFDVASNMSVIDGALLVSNTNVGGTLDVSGNSQLGGSVNAAVEVVIQVGSIVDLLGTVNTPDLQWFDSTIQGPGRIEASSDLTVAVGAGPHVLRNGATLVGLPSSITTIANPLRLGNGATLEVAGNGILNASILADPGASSIFRNFGSLAVGTDATIGVRFDNFGAVDVGLDNDLTLLGGGTSTAGFFMLNGNDGSARLRIGAPYTFSGANTVAGDLGDPGTVLELFGGAVLDLIGAGSTIDNLVLDGGTVRNLAVSPLQVTELTWFGGGFEGLGQTNVDHMSIETLAPKSIALGQQVRIFAASAMPSFWLDGSLAFSDGGGLRIDLGTLNYVASNPGVLSSSSGGALNVQAGARFNVSLGANLAVFAPLFIAPGGVIETAGALDLAGGGVVLGQLRSIDQSVTPGSLRLSGGNLTIDAGGLVEGAGSERVVVASGATVSVPNVPIATLAHARLEGGQLQLAGTLDAPDMQLVFGEVTGAPGGRMRLLGNSVIGDPNLLLRIGGGVAVETHGPAMLSGVEVRLEGMGRIEVPSGQALQILDGVNSGGPYAPRISVGPGGGELVTRFAGSLVRPAASTLTTRVEAFMRQEGTIDILGGALELAGNGQLDGVVTLAPGTVLAFVGNNYVLGVNDWQVVGAGEVRFDAGVYNIAPSDIVQLDVPTQMTGGSLNLGGTLLATNLFDLRGGLIATSPTGQLELGGLFVFEGGTLSGPGRTTVLPTGAIRLLTDSDRIVRDGHTLRIANQMMGNPLQSIWRNGALTLQNNALVEVEPDAQLDLQPETGAPKVVRDGGGATSTLRLLPGTNAFVNANAPFVVETRIDIGSGGGLFAENSQVILAGGGTVAGAIGAESNGLLTLTVLGATLLLLDGSEVGSDTGGQTAVGGGVVSVVGGATASVLFDGLEQDGRIDIGSGGTLQVLASSLRMSDLARFTGAGTLLVDSASTFTSLGAVTIDGTQLNLASGANWNGTVLLSSGARIENGASFQTTGLDVLAGPGGGTFFNAASGDLLVQSGNLAIDTLFDSIGSIAVQDGELQLRGLQSNLAGSVALADGASSARLRLSGGITQIGATSFSMDTNSLLLIDGGVARLASAVLLPRVRMDAGRIDLFDGVLPRVTAGMLWNGGAIGRAPGVSVMPRFDIDAPLIVGASGGQRLEGTELASFQPVTLGGDVQLAFGARWSVTQSTFDFAGGNLLLASTGERLDLLGSQLTVPSNRAATLGVRLEARPFGSGTPVASRIVVASNGSLTLGAGGLLDAAPLDIATSGAFVVGAGLLELTDNTTINGTLTLDGSLLATGGITSNGVLTGNGSLTGALISTGQIVVADGEVLTLGGGNVTTNGSISLANTGRLVVNGDLLANGASLLGGAVDIAGDLRATGNVNLTSALTAIVLDVNGSGTLASVGDLMVDRITLGNAGQLVLGGTAVVGSGGITLTGASQLTLADATVSGLLDIQDGTLVGTGTLNGNLLNSGVVSVGNSPGVLVVNGNFTQAADGMLIIEIGGAGAFQPGVNYDQLVVNGTATLGGALQFVQLDDFGGFDARGDLQPLMYSGFSGDFATVASVGDPDFDPQIQFGAGGAFARAVLTPPGEPEENTGDVSQDVAELADQQEELENCGEEEDTADIEAQSSDSHGVGCRGM